MEKVILEFVSCCRVDGMRISTAEVLDCLRQLELAGLADAPAHGPVSGRTRGNR